MIKISVFDDHKARRDALKLILSLHPEMICLGNYENCGRLVEDLKDNTPDVVLMDINMPGIDGIEGVKLIRKYYPGVYIIMQTVFDDDGKIFDCLLAGAHGYILKSASHEQILEGILEVVNGGAPMTPSVARRVLNFFHRKSDRPGQECYNLSKRETELLKLLVKGYSRKVIAAELFISINTVNNHIKSIYEKLHVHSHAEVVAIALKNNMV